MQRWLYAADGTSLYRETAPNSGNPYAFLWPFSRALLGTLALAGIPANLVGGVNYAPAVQDRLHALAHYCDPTNSGPPAYASYVVPPYGNGGDRYHDDNAWVALALIQAYRVGLTDSLDRPNELFAFARSGWDSEPADPYPGGIFWVEQGKGQGLTNHDRGAGATAASAGVGLHLQELTASEVYAADAGNRGDASDATDPRTATDAGNPGDASDPRDHRDASDPRHAGDRYATARTRSLGWQTMLGWVSQHLDSSRNGSGPFLNAVRRDGSIDTNLWAYNQGVMIGARVLEHRLTITRDPAPSAGPDASVRRVPDPAVPRAAGPTAMPATEPAADLAAVPAADPTAEPAALRAAEAIARQMPTTFGDFTSQPPSFSAMCFQNLLMLHAASRDPTLQSDILHSMQRYAAWTWDPATSARDPETNLFYFTDAGQPARGSQPAKLQDQAAMTQLYGLLAWPPANYSHLT